MSETPALIITYNPTVDLVEKIDSLLREFDEIIMVDNGSSLETRATIQKLKNARGSKLKTILNDRNLGVATALNQGFLLAIQLGYKSVIALDQDSIPVSGMKNALSEAYQTHPNKEKLAVLAPDIIENALGKPSRYIRSKGIVLFERTTCSCEILRNVSFVITSGSMYNLKLYERIGPFREDFFIDAVDTEYCLRSKSRGYEISIACRARIEHHLGKRQQKQLFGKLHSPTFHPPFRWYYISRNRIKMIYLYGWRFPHWLFYEITIAITSLVRMLLFENQRTIKVKAVLLGTWHGVINKRGEMPLEVKKSLMYQ